MSIVRWNLEEAGGKAPVRGTRTVYKAYAGRASLPKTAAGHSNWAADWLWESEISNNANSAEKSPLVSLLKMKGELSYVYRLASILSSEG